MQRYRCAQDRWSAIPANLNRKLAAVAVRHLFGNLAERAQGTAKKKAPVD
jgi:hypothetical protein